MEKTPSREYIKPVLETSAFAVGLIIPADVWSDFDRVEPRDDIVDMLTCFSTSAQEIFVTH